MNHNQSILCNTEIQALGTPWFVQEFKSPSERSLLGMDSVGSRPRAQRTTISSAYFKNVLPYILRYILRYAGEEYNQLVRPLPAPLPST